MNIKKISTSLLLLSISTITISNELLSTVLIKSEGIGIGFVLEGDDDKIFSITEEQIFKKSSEMDRRELMRHFIMYSDKPTLVTISSNQNSQGSTNQGSGITPLIQQIYLDHDYIEHDDHGGTVITPITERADHPPNHGGGVFSMSLSSTSARLLAAEECDKHFSEYMYADFGYDEFVPYFHENTSFSKVIEVEFSPSSAPMLLESHGDPEYVIDFTLNFKCAYKIK